MSRELRNLRNPKEIKFSKDRFLKHGIQTVNENYSNEDLITEMCMPF